MKNPPQLTRLPRFTRFSGFFEAFSAGSSAQRVDLTRSALFQGTGRADRPPSIRRGSESGQTDGSILQRTPRSGSAVRAPPGRARPWRLRAIAGVSGAIFRRFRRHDTLESSSNRPRTVPEPSR
jgi:hypothetical protein